MNYIAYITGQLQDAKNGKGSTTSKWWAMLSTMKFAIWMLILLGALSLMSMFVGELVDPRILDAEPKDSLGAAGRLLYMAFQMDDAFGSWWYRGLIGLLSLSLFACVFERTPIILKLWRRKPSPDLSWRSEVKTAIIKETRAEPRAVREAFGSYFSWKIKSDDVWVGERGRLGMWGPLLTHYGFLFLALGALLTSFGTFATRSGGFAGETVSVDGMPFEVRVDSFRVQYYPLQVGQVVLGEGEWVGKIISQNADGSWMVERWITHDEKQTVSLLDYDMTNHWDNDRDRGNIKRFVSFVTVFEDGKEVDQAEIAVNDPLRRHGYRLYQSSYDPEHPRISAFADSVSIAVEDTSGQLIQTLKIAIGQSAVVPGDTLTVTAGKVLPNFKMDDQFKPYSASADFANPAVELTFAGPNGYEKNNWSFLNFGGHGRAMGKHQYRITELHGERASLEYATIFEIKKTSGGEVLWLGFLVATVGIILCFYVTHRVIYVEWKTAGKDSITLIGLTRKTAHLYEIELDRILGRVAHSAEAPALVSEKAVA